MANAHVLLAIPGRHAEEELRRAVTDPSAPPLVLLAEGASEPDAVRWLAMGAADVLTSGDSAQLAWVVQREACRRGRPGDLNSVLQRSTAFVMSLDHELQITWINRKPDGLDVDDAIGRHILEITDRPDHVRVQAVLSRVLQTGEVSEYEARSRNGIWCRTQIAPIRMGGAIVGLCLVALDISESRRVELELRSSEARLKSLFETTPDAILTITAQGIIESVNASAERLFGYSRTELIGRDAGVLLQRNKSHRFATLVGRLGGRLTGRVFEYIASRRDGREFPVSLSVGSWNFAGETRYSAIVRDLSDQKRAEFDLAHANTRLITAARRAGMSDVARGALHNIGNSMTSLSIAATIMARRLERSRAEPLVQIASRCEEGQTTQAAEALRHMATAMASEHAEQRKLVEGMNKRLEEIRGILHAQQDYARSGGVAQKTNPATLVDDALAQHRYAIRAQDVHVTCAIEQLPELELDRIRILQVLSNLVKNSLESMADAKPEERRLNIRVYAARGRLMIEVGDNGLGFDEATRTQLFRSGFTTKTAGQGLGLHFCFNTLHELGGDIRAASEGRGKGATFVIELPAEELGRASAVTVKIGA